MHAFLSHPCIIRATPKLHPALAASLPLPNTFKSRLQPIHTLSSVLLWIVFPSTVPVMTRG